METIKDISYGVVPIYVDGADLRVLLIHQISHRGGRNTFWIFPKGHGEHDESPQQAALRELEEETGLTSVTLDPDFVTTVSYSFVHDGTKVEKTVLYYIGYCASESTHITQPEEVIELTWCSLREAEDRLSHQNSKEVLRQVAVFLEAKKEGRA